MPRNRVRKTSRGKITQEIMDLALDKIVKDNKSIRSVGKEYSIPYSTLNDYYKKVINPNMTKLPKVGYNSHKKVFTDEQEKEICEYLVQAANIFYGLSTKDVRKLAFEIAKLKNLKYPVTWEVNGLAGDDWFYGFMKRNKNMSIRKPQATSLSRTTSFNKTNVENFFKNLQEVLTTHQYEPQNIWNIDETGITTVQNPVKIVTAKGTKQVGSHTSAERGTLITMCAGINALGNFIPPHFIFPRLRYRDHFVDGGPIGSIGSGNKSGWMTEVEFLVFIRHFVRYSHSSKENPNLLLLDNHESHISIPVIDFCKSNGVTLLSFHPHCSHKLQPLDRTVFGPLKKNFNRLADAWMKKNPGKTMTIYNIPALVKEAFSLAFTPSNITNGFKCTGVYPYNANIFTEEDFLPSYVTDRPPNLVGETNNMAPSAPKISVRGPGDNAAGPSGSNFSQNSPGFASVEVQNTPADRPENEIGLNLKNTFPFPKAEPRVPTRRGKKKKKSEILTSTPVRNELQAEVLSRASKNVKVLSAKKTATPIKKASKIKPRRISK